MENKDIFLLWAKSIDVQQHFNEIELKVRQLTLTVFTFIISGIGFMIKENKGVFSGIIPIEAIISAIGSIIIYAFFFMDKHWYHRLLKGAVGFSLKLEEQLFCQINYYLDCSVNILIIHHTSIRQAGMIKFQLTQES